MKIVLSTWVRHDEDIIEQAIDNNLLHVDKIYVYVHNPYPRIIEILNKYKNNERVIVKSIHSPTLEQDVKVNQIFKEVVDLEKDMDIYFHLDADEFIFDLNEVKSKIKPGSVFRAPILELFRSMNEDKNNRVKEFNWELWNKTNYYFSKDNVNKVKIGHGQHIWKYDDGTSIDTVNLENPFYIHFPWRNKYQAFRKITEIWSMKLGENSLPTEIFRKYVENTFLNGVFDETHFWDTICGNESNVVVGFDHISKYEMLFTNPILIKDDEFYIKNPIKFSDVMEAQYESLTLWQELNERRKSDKLNSKKVKTINHDIVNKDFEDSKKKSNKGKLNNHNLLRFFKKN